MDENRYITLGGAGTGEYIEKKSRFIANAKPCQTEEEALCFIREMKKQYADARHNVYAYVIKENNLSRYTDDGEPQGTAGLPVLDVIRKSGFTDACIVVTRYFGGVLLGTGGLCRAYTAAAKAAVDDARIVTYEAFRTMRISCSYADYQKISASLHSFPVLTDSTDFGVDVILTLACRKAETDAFLRFVTDQTGGRAGITETGERFDSNSSEKNGKK